MKTKPIDYLALSTDDYERLSGKESPCVTCRGHIVAIMPDNSLQVKASCVTLQDALEIVTDLNINLNRQAKA